MAKVQNRLPSILGELKTRDDVKTQKALATLLGMDEAKLSRLLRMQPSDLVSVDLLDKLHEKFGLTPNDVLFYPEVNE